MYDISMFNRKCKITFISHGATVYSEENRICTDNGNYPPLNDAGEEEIEKICQWLKTRGVQNDKIYTSPSLRAIQSAQMISKVFKKDFEVVDGLTSRKCGVWSGLTYDDIEEKYPQLLDKIHENPCSFQPDGGEAILDFDKRIVKIIKKIVDENTGNRIIMGHSPGYNPSGDKQSHPASASTPRESLRKKQEAPHK